MAIGESTEGMYASPLQDSETVHQAVKGYNHKIQLLTKQLEGLPQDSKHRAKVIDEIQKNTEAKKLLETYAGPSIPSQKPLSAMKQHAALHEKLDTINTLIKIKVTPKAEKETLKALNTGIGYRLTTLEQVQLLKTKIKNTTDQEFLTTVLEGAASKGNKEIVEYILKKHPDVTVRDAAKFAKRRGHEEIWKMLIPLKKYRVMERRSQEDPGDLEALEYILLYNLDQLERQTPKKKMMVEVQELLNKGIPTQKEALAAFRRAFEQDDREVMKLLGPHLENIHLTIKDALDTWDMLKERLIEAVKKTSKKSPGFLSYELLSVSDDLLAHFRNLHPKDAIYFLLEVVRPHSLGELVCYNEFLLPQEATSAHEVEGVSVEYDFDTKFKDLQAELEEKLPGKKVVLLRNDLYSGLWLPIDLSEDPEIWEIDQFAVAIIDKEGNGAVHVMPIDPEIKINFDKNTSSGSLEEVD